MKAPMLTDEQLNDFETQGYVHVPQVFPADKVQALLAAVAELGARASTAADTRRWWSAFHDGACTPQAQQSADYRNVAMASDVFANLVDAAEILVPVVQILGPRVALLGTHAVVRAHTEGLSAEELARTRLGWHRDLGVSSIDMAEPHPRLAVKAAVWLTPLTGSGQGAMRVVPGSHRLIGEPAFDSATNQPFGAVEVLAEPGDVLLFEQRLWHAGAPNISLRPRVSLFYCYGFRWLRPQDYTDIDVEKLAAMSPVRQQLFGSKTTTIGHHLPTPEDVPLETWSSSWKGSADEPVARNA
ncbi:phytanoyl-CoA dioxygenase PhyH [Micromonospora sp. Llam0]|uniref:phytanoyl-CoA dioxygenase family protein n=1 Tax=Micromonospora sp. Llam0 TaxID=2485143 RepID=UPI000F4AED59|nr:phytanoyl-CoA dioxygenase family protein [Micromonospora sp. Llam0]ROO52679.1 phytanoyl-CoA dioxygenase PhyH [Micromonospora sp. Llam0]